MKEEVKVFPLRIPKDLHRVLKLNAVETDVSMNDFINQAINEKLEKEINK